ncbi:MAG: ureidoglycolate lyase [Candidatus Rokuibacteriota bacterium]
MDIVAEPLTAKAFESFGWVLEGPAEPGRVYVSEMLANARPGARLNLSVVKVDPLKALPLEAKVLERHEFSSQTFFPLRVSRYLVVVAPDAPEGGPDVSQVRAFVARSGQGITYRMGTWHHGLTVLDSAAELAVLMWTDGTRGDEEFVPVSPFTVHLLA